VGASDEDLEVERIEPESGIPDLYGCIAWTLAAVVVLALIAAGFFFLAFLLSGPYNL
jgi:hypothetical protein